MKKENYDEEKNIWQEKEKMYLEQIKEQKVLNTHLKRQIKGLKQGTRYKVGNAIVLAAKPSKHTLLLPIKLLQYTKEGIIKRYLTKQQQEQVQEKLQEKSKIKVSIKSIQHKEVKKIELSENELLVKLENDFNECTYKEKLGKGKKLYREYKNLGRLSKSKELLEILLEVSPNSNFYKQELEITIDKLSMLSELKEDGLEYCINLYRQEDNNKILHVLNNTIPYHKNGYGIRSKYIIESQKKAGLNPVVITRPGFPNDFKANSLLSNEELIKEEIEDISYYRCLSEVLLRYTPITQYIEMYVEQILKVIEIENSGIIHSASNYINGLAGLKAAQIAQLPFVYEIRGFWELTTVSKYPDFKNSEEFQLAQYMETYIAKSASQVIVISEGLKQELIKRGIEEEKIHIVPNGVDCKQFYSVPYNRVIADKLGVEGKFTIGYIGSIVKYEGLQNIIYSVKQLKEEGINHIRVIIVGDGDYKRKLEKLTRELELTEEVIFTGRIEHSEVIEYYSIFDLCIFPRLQEEVTEMVTPLKPLEAMACGKCVIGSDLQAIKEMVIEDTNGIIYDNSIEDLANKIRQFACNEVQVDLYQDKAKIWVEKNRDWNILAKKYSDLYNEIIK